MLLKNFYVVSPEDIEKIFEKKMKNFQNFKNFEGKFSWKKRINLILFFNTF
jgi:hypothetical protein